MAERHDVSRTCPGPQFATRYTRYLDKHGFLRFYNWKLYGERGLAHQPISVWVYEGTLKVEHQAVTLSKYTVELQEDHKHVREVSHPRLADTPFRSPQLTLLDVSPNEWLLYWRTPTSTPVRRKHRSQEIVQLPLFDLSSQEKVVGANETKPVEHPRTFLQIVPPPPAEPDMQ